jgi:hypothetical protein
MRRLRVKKYGKYDRNYGKNCVFCFGTDGKPQFSIGPHWYLGFVILGMIYFIAKTMISQTLKVEAYMASYLITALVIIELYAYFMTAITNPGYVS